MSEKRASYLMVSIIFLLLTGVYFFVMGDSWGWLKWGPVAIFAIVGLGSLIVVFRTE